jgi:hypothetical protein
MYKRRWLQGVIRPLAAKICRGPPAKLIIDQRQEVVHDLRFAAAPLAKHFCNIGPNSLVLTHCYLFVIIGILTDASNSVCRQAKLF